MGKGAASRTYFAMDRATSCTRAFASENELIFWMIVVFRRICRKAQQMLMMNLMMRTMIPYPYRRSAMWRLRGLSAEAATYVREVAILGLNNREYVPQAVDGHTANILAFIKVIEPV